MPTITLRKDTQRHMPPKPGLHPHPVPPPPLPEKERHEEEHRGHRPHDWPETPPAPKHPTP
jgi:hypothetical protein